MPTVTRRPHAKSRQGCAECRRRRIKCDEGKPSCRQCVRRASSCVYPRSVATSAAPAPNTFHDVAGSSGGSQTSGTNATTTPASLLTPHSQPSPNGSVGRDYTLRDLRLLHQWTVTTSRTLGVDHPDIVHFWQIVFPQMGFQHTFVLDGVLGLAALHQAHLDHNSREQWIAEAAEYHNLLIHGFRTAVADSAEAYCDPLFVCASINIIFVFGMHGSMHAASEGDAARISRYLGTEWIPMVRGLNAALLPMYQRIRTGPLAPLLDLSLFEAVDLERDKSVDDEYIILLRSTWAADSHCQTYEETHLLLRTCFAYMNSCKGRDNTAWKGHYNQALSGPLIWVFLAPDEYFSLLAQRQPPALILLAYLGVLFHRLNSVWFLEDWGRAIVEAVDNVLGPWWQEWMNWPKAQTQTGCPVPSAGE